MGHRLPIDEIELDRRLVHVGGLYEFVRLAWHIIEPAPFVEGWHVQEICNHLEAVSLGKLRRLVINIPPGCGKSLTVSVFWPVWEWIYRPYRKFMFASFDASLSQRDSMKAKEVICSKWFQERWGFSADFRKLDRLGIKAVHVLTDQNSRQNTATIYWSSGGGLRFSTSVGGKATGWHANIQVCDDPVKPQDVAEGGDTARNALGTAERWWRSTMASRKADPNDFSRVIIMQRLHTEDLAGVCIRDGYTLLRLPMEYESKAPCVTPVGGDRRTMDGEILTTRFSPEAVKETREEMGPRVAAAQLQQRPTPDGGTIFQRDWMVKRWKEIPAQATYIQSWDCTFKGASTSDYVVGQVWAKHGAEFFLVDQIRARMDLPSTCQAIKDMRAKWPKARLIVIENKANGPAVEQVLRKEVPGIVLWDPKVGKVERANAITPFFAAGNVYLPEWTEWVGDFVEELCSFPLGANDDQVDATTQALLRLGVKTSSRLKEAMANVRRNG